MSELTLFGPCSMTPARFAAMAPHLKTEAIRLFAERGLPVREMLTMTGATLGDLMAAGNQPHKIKLETGERVACPTGERQLGLSDSARFVLLMMQNQAGTLAASLGSISYDIGKSESSVRDALKLLTGRELIEMTVPSSGKNHPAQYRMTKAGEEMAEKLAAEPAREARDA